MLSNYFECPWKIGSHVCLGNAEKESQCSQGKEDTKLNWNVYISKAENAEKIVTTSLEKYVGFVAITFASPEVSVTASKQVHRREKMGT